MSESPRLGLPSASSFHMDVACPGRQNLLRSIPEHERVIDVEDEMASRGSRIHNALELDDVSLLSEEEMIDWAKCKENATKAFEDWLGTVPPSSDTAMPHKETRLWLHDNNMRPVMSGQPDLVYTLGKHAICLDYKTGFNRHLSPSERSWQLRVLAVLVAQHYSCTDVRVVYIKPKAYDKIDATDYTQEWLKKAEMSILNALWASGNSDAPRAAGKHCNFCAAKLQCPEAAAMTLLPTVVAGVSKGVKKANVETAVQRLGPADWKYIHERGSVIRNILDAANKCLKQLSPDDLKSLSLVVGEGRRLTPITNTIGAYTALEHTLKPEQLWACLKFDKAKVEAAIKEAKGLTEKEAKAWVRDNLAPFITEDRAEGALEEIEK